MEKKLNRYKIPVSYSVSGIIEIESTDVISALEYAINNIDSIEFPHYTEYIYI